MSKSECEVVSETVKNELSKVQNKLQQMASIKETFSFVYNCGVGTRAIFAIGTFASVLNGLVGPMVCSIMSLALASSSAIKIEEIAFEDLQRTSKLLAGLGFYTLLLTFIQTICFHIVSSRATRSLSYQWFQALVRQDAAFFDVYDITGMANSIQPSCMKYQHGMGTSLGEGIQFCTAVAGGGIFALAANWKVAIMVFAVAPLTVSMCVIQMKRVRSISSNAAKVYRKAGNVAYSSLVSIKTVFSFNITDTMIQRYCGATQEAYQITTKQLVKGGFINGIFMSSFVSLFVVVALFGSFLIYRDVEKTGCDPSAAIADNSACHNTGVRIFGAFLGFLFAAQGLIQVVSFIEAFIEASVAVNEALFAINRSVGAPREIIYKPAACNELDAIEEKKEETPNPDLEACYTALTLDTDHDTRQLDRCSPQYAAIKQRRKSRNFAEQVVVDIATRVTKLIVANEQGEETKTDLSTSERVRNISAILPRYEIDSCSTVGLKPKHVKGHISFKNVYFSYPTRPTGTVLRDFSLDIKTRQTVALVGPSGGGKSTVMSMLERFYDPTAGCIELDGIDLRNINVPYLRSLIGYVGQEPTLFATSIRKNIEYGCPGATQEQIEQAAKMAAAHDFISQFPDGYDTQVGDKGSQLSGGQKQRIAIARVLVGRPKVLLLDEATSALDNESEHLVQDAIDKVLAKSNMTTIIIAHRLSTIRNADLIVVVADHSVIETGSHEELMLEPNGFYRNLVEGQEGSEQCSSKHDGKCSPNSTDPNTDSTSLSCLVEASNYPSEGNKLSEEEWSNSNNSTSAETEAQAQEEIGPSDDAIEDNASRSHKSESIGRGVQPQPPSMPNADERIILGGGETNSMTKSEFRGRKADDSSEDEVIHVEEKRCTGREAQAQQDNAAAGDNNVSLEGESSLIKPASAVETHGSDYDTENIKIQQGGNSRLTSESTEMGGLDLALLWGGRSKEINVRVQKQIALPQGNEITGGSNTLQGGGSNLMNRESVDVEAQIQNRIPDLPGTENCISSQEERRSAVMIQQQASHAPRGECISPKDDISQCRRSKWESTEIQAQVHEQQAKGDDDADFVEDSMEEDAIATSIASVASTDSASRNSDDSYIVPQIRFNNVYFSYPTRRTRPILQGLNMSIKAGETVALVGPSGGGKSTVVSLIERFYDPSEGTIEYMGHDLRTINTRWYRDEIGYVSQEPTLFNDSIANNIAYGSPYSTQQMIVDAARQANAHSFITSFPEGYNTPVGGGGAQLSGGQKQRVAIARALVKQPKVLIFDEATSALDIESEALVQATLHKLMESGRCTIIIIAHRLSTVRDADRIAFIADGKVHEFGSHEELLALGGRYARLVAAQKRDSNLESLRLMGNLAESDDGSEKSHKVIEFDDSLERDDFAKYFDSKRALRLMLPYSFNILLGIIGSIMQGFMYPAWGILFANTVDLLFQPVLDCPDDDMIPVPGFCSCEDYWSHSANTMRKASFHIGVLWAALALDWFVGAVLVFVGFGTAAAGLVKSLRDEAFMAFLRQEVSFFDSNKIGIMMSMLQDDTFKVYQFSKEPARQISFGFSSILIGLGIAFSIMWPVALVAIGCLPFMVFSSLMVASKNLGVDQGCNDNDEVDYASPGGIITETLTNIRTVSALNLECERLSSYKRSMEQSRSKMMKQTIRLGLADGFGYAFLNWIFAIVFYFGGWLLFKYPERYSLLDILRANFSLYFSLFGLAMAFRTFKSGDDIKRATGRIFYLLDRRSTIDALSRDGKQLDSLPGRSF